MPASCYCHAVGHIQLKGISDEVHAELRRRARAEGVTIRDYVLRLIERDQARPSKQEWVRRVQQLTPRPVGTIEDLRADREGRDRELDDRSRTA
jgi:hypothetical protein